VIVLDWFSRKVVGWQLSWRCRTQEWREALEEAVLYQVALKQIIYQQPQTLTCHRTGETPVPPIITFLMATWYWY
jgi:transposase InsO family protein